MFKLIFHRTAARLEMDSFKGKNQSNRMEAELRRLDLELPDLVGLMRLVMFPLHLFVFTLS